MLGTSKAPVLDLGAVRNASTKSIPGVEDDDDQDLHNAMASAMSARDDSDNRKLTQHLIALGRAEEKRRVSSNLKKQQKAQRTAAAAADDDDGNAGGVPGTEKSEEKQDLLSGGLDRTGATSSSSAAEAGPENGGVKNIGKVENDLLSALAHEREQHAENADAANQRSGDDSRGAESREPLFETFDFANPFATHLPRPRQQRPKQSFFHMVSNRGALQMTMNGDALAPRNTQEYHSSLGRKFVQYWRERGVNPYDQARIPPVDVSYKIYKISNVDETQGTFAATFTIMLDWKDESVIHAYQILQQELQIDDPYIDFQEHFFPRFEIEHTEVLEVVGAVSKPRIKADRKKGAFCTLTQKFSAVFNNRLTFHDFPLDFQHLEISLKMFPVTDGIHPFSNMGEDTGGYHGYITCRNPSRYRFKKGHIMSPTADWLIDWKFVKICGEPRNKNFIKIKGGRKNKENGGSDVPANDLYCFQLLIARNPWKWMMDYILIIALIDGLSITAFANPIEKVADRLMVSITMALTGMAFKVVISEKLPNLPYLTLLDWYLLMTFMLISITGVYFAVMRVALVNAQLGSGAVEVSLWAYVVQRGCSGIHRVSKIWTET